MDGIWMFNLDGGDIWQGEEFHTKEIAIEEGKKEARKIQEEFCGDSFQVGQLSAVQPSGVDVDFILENVAENTVQDLEVGENYLADVTEEHSKELEQKLNDVLFDWMNEHGYNPSFYTIENIEKINL